MKIPAGHHTAMPYLMLENARDFQAFVEAVFPATLSHISLNDNKLIRHAEFRIGDSTIMFCNAQDKWDAQPSQLFIYVDDADKSYQTALDNGATSVMELSDQPYGRTCGVKDPCGNTWWITSVQ